MEIINLGQQNSIFNHFIREIRDVNIQKDSMRFRRNIERIGEVFAYEISKKMEYENKRNQWDLFRMKPSIILKNNVYQI